MGEVFHDGLRDVVDVWVTAEALNAGNQIVGRGMAFVTSYLPGRGTTTFTVKLPRVEEARSFRLVVSIRIRGAIAVTILAARPGGIARRPTMTEPMARWLVVCSCGWTRETSSEWAASSVAKLHPKLSPKDVEHVTRVEPPPGHGETQLTLV